MPEEHEYAKNTCNILLVEGNSLLQETIPFELNQRGFNQVTVAANLEEACNSLKERKFTHVILDIAYEPLVDFIKAANQVGSSVLFLTWIDIPDGVKTSLKIECLDSTVDSFFDQLESFLTTTKT